MTQGSRAVVPRPKEEMANEFNLGIADLMSVFALEGIASYTGLTGEVVQGHDSA